MITQHKLHKANKSELKSDQDSASLRRSRFRLKQYQQEQDKEPLYFHAVFNYITHKDSHGRKTPVILLTDIYPVTKAGKKIRMADDSDFKDSKNRHIAADHCWVKLTKNWFNISYNDLKHIELFKGDEIWFNARIEEYKITRKDTLAERNAIFKTAQKKCDQIYQRWQHYTDTHYRKNFQLSLNQMKKKQQKIMEQAKADQQKIKLVDYSFNYIKQIKILRLISDIKSDKVSKKGYIRQRYDWNQYQKQGYKYTAYLAARSMSYTDGKSWNEDN